MTVTGDLQRELFLFAPIDGLNSVLNLDGQMANYGISVKPTSESVCLLQTCMNLIRECHSSSHATLRRPGTIRMMSMSDILYQLSNSGGTDNDSAKVQGEERRQMASSQFRPTTSVSRSRHENANAHML